MEKKKIQNKKQKAKPQNKSIDWNALGEKVMIIAIDHKHMEEGKEYRVTKEIAKILVEKKAAKLK